MYPDNASLRDEAATASSPEASIPSAMTPRGRDFVRVNRLHSVVSGQWLDKDRRAVRGGPETWVKLRYRLDNGQQFTLNERDLAGLHSIGFEPVWWGDRHKTTAQAIEARRAETGTGSVHESAVPEECAQEQSSTPDSYGEGSL